MLFDGYNPENCPFPWGCRPHVIYGSLAHANQPEMSKPHLDRFSRFCRAHDRDQQTDRQTDHATPSVEIGRI